MADSDRFLDVRRNLAADANGAECERVIRDLRELLDALDRTMRPSRVTVFKPADIKAVRKKLRASQSEFALMIGVNVSTLRNWEQGRRVPDGPALALLRVASKNPAAVAEALHGWRGAA